MSLTINAEPKPRFIPKLTASTLYLYGRPRGRVLWCDVCEALHHHAISSDGADVFAPQCFDGPGSPYASTGYFLSESGRVAASDDARPSSPFAERETFWRRCLEHKRRLQANAAAAILGRTHADVIVSCSIDNRDFRLCWSQWDFGCGDAGTDLLTLIDRLYVVRPGVAAVRLLEAVTGVRFDAPAFLEIINAVEAFYERGAPAEEGRRA